MKNKIKKNCLFFIFFFIELVKKLIIEKKKVKTK